ncbi:FAD/NAD(P)-binding protein [Burkholderia sp. Bp9004]|uniref:FAD/NAD(P)-binding protein n=1 Tax=Burkholderia sp. Bp9004 TaxID=2184559 RepID=UPI001639EB1C|nr:FAD/NAD(P)-binding protein [Burkholderia sp. Bp9004]
MIWKIQEYGVTTSKNATVASVAIVGGGAACVSLLHQMMQLYADRRPAPIDILVFERKFTVGPGLAYQEDGRELVLNRVADAMSISPTDATLFSRWMLWKASYSREICEATGEGFPDTYVARRLFGRFLHDAFLEIQRVAAGCGISVRVIHETVTAIDRRSVPCVRTASGSWPATHVVLATGHTNPKDYYGLAGHDRYLHFAYPVSKHLETLRSATSICILGASLTAIDVAVSLQAAGYHGRIDMLSRRGLLPYVKGKSYPPHTLRHLTGHALTQMTGAGTAKIGLRTMFRLFRRELRAVGVDWKVLFGAEYGPADVHLDAQIRSAGEIKPWSPVFRALNGLVHDLWHALDQASQHLFLARFARRWMSIRTPIPLQNATRVQAMMRTGQLRILSGSATFAATPCGRIDMTRNDGAVQRYDMVVNATGTATCIDTPDDSALIWSLLQSGIADRDARGGIKVDFESGALVSRTGSIDPNIRALGHVTSGTYFYVDSLDMISRQAERIARALAMQFDTRPQPVAARDIAGSPVLSLTI